MAYPNGPRNDNRYNTPREVSTPDFPEEYVDFAERLMKDRYRMITTSKLRNILSLLMDVYNTEMLRTEDAISQESAVKLQVARIRIAYECGRDRNTKEFVDAAHLLPWLKDVGDSRARTLRFVHYLEAIVAYHRFFGGREN